MRFEAGCTTGIWLKRPLPTLAVLLFLATLPVAAFSHPDLLLQIEILDAKIEAGPVTAEVLIKRGDLYRRHEDYPAATRDFEAARELDPGNSLLDFYQGRLLLENGDPASAELHLARYLSSHSQHAKAWMLRGEAGIRLGKPASAAEFFGLAIKHSKAASPALYRLLILSLLASGESNWNSAEQTVESGLGHFGIEVTLLGLGTDIALARNRPEQAQRYLDLLPVALRGLAQWDRRIRIADCMTTSAAPERTQCERLARSNLSDQVHAFMTEG